MSELTALPSEADAKKRPASQYYWGDWWKDKGLHSCSLAARGLWHEMNCLMHEGEPYGHLTLNGRAMTTAQLANQCRISPSVCVKLLGELTDAGVPSKTPEGVIYSRRMVRDEAIRNARAMGGKAGAEHGIKGAEHGSKGGRPNTPRGVSEAPSEGGFKPPPSSSSSSSSSGEQVSKASPSHPAGPGKTTPTIPCPYDAIVDAYHRELPTLPAVRLRDGSTWTKRQKAMRSLWGWVLSSRKSDGTPRAESAEQALAWVAGYFGRAAQNDFVMGRTKRSDDHANWQADFDFLLTDKGMRQVIEKTQDRAA